MRYAIIFCLVMLSACSEKKHEGHAVNSEIYYTCSMDPQVVEDKPGKCPICKMPLTPVKRSGNENKDDIQLSDQQIRLGNISVDTIRYGNMGNEFVLNAVLNFDHTKTSAVSSRVMGRVEQLYFKNIGEYVRQGDKLYDIYSEELNNAKQEYLLALERQKTFAANDAIDFNSLLQSAKNKLALWGMSNGQIRELERERKIEAITTFYSEDNGYITQLDIRQGDYVMAGGTIVQLADLSTLWAEAQVYASQYSQIQQNGSATVSIPEVGNISIKGKVNSVNPEITTGSRINLIRISINNPDKILKPGMAAYVHLSSLKQNSMILPIDAVIQDAKAATVWVKTGKNTFRSRMVKVGAVTKNTIEITSGLMQGDLVVITGAYLINSEYIFKKGTNPMEGHDM